MEKVNKDAQKLGKLGGRPKRQASETLKIGNRQAYFTPSYKTAKHGARGA